MQSGQMYPVHFESEWQASFSPGYERMADETRGLEIGPQFIYGPPASKPECFWLIPCSYQKQTYKC